MPLRCRFRISDRLNSANAPITDSSGAAVATAHESDEQQKRPLEELVASATLAKDR